MSLAFIQSLDYLDDLEEFYWIGGGYKINYEMAAVLLREIFDTMRAKINGSTEILGKFFFAHAETTLPFMTLMGYGDRSPLLANATKADIKTRGFRTSNLSPFAANIEFRLYQLKSPERGVYEIDVRKVSVYICLDLQSPLRARGQLTWCRMTLAAIGRPTESDEAPVLLEVPVGEDEAPPDDVSGKKGTSSTSWNPGDQDVSKCGKIVQGTIAAVEEDDTAEKLSIPLGSLLEVRINHICSTFPDEVDYVKEIASAENGKGQPASVCGRLLLIGKSSQRAVSTAFINTKFKHCENQVCARLQTENGSPFSLSFELSPDVVTNQLPQLTLEIRSRRSKRPRPPQTLLSIALPYLLKRLLISVEYQCSLQLVDEQERACGHLSVCFRCRLPADQHNGELLWKPVTHNPQPCILNVKVLNLQVTTKGYKEDQCLAKIWSSSIGKKRAQTISPLLLKDGESTSDSKKTIATLLKVSDTATDVFYIGIYRFSTHERNELIGLGSFSICSGQLLPPDNKSLATSMEQCVDLRTETAEFGNECGSVVLALEATPIPIDNESENSSSFAATGLGDIAYPVQRSDIRYRIDFDIQEVRGLPSHVSEGDTISLALRVMQSNWKAELGPAKVVRRANTDCMLASIADCAQTMVYWATKDRSFPVLEVLVYVHQPQQSNRTGMTSKSSLATTMHPKRRQDHKALKVSKRVTEAVAPSLVASGCLNLTPLFSQPSTPINVDLTCPFDTSCESESGAVSVICRLRSSPANLDLQGIEESSMTSTDMHQSVKGDVCIHVLQATVTWNQQLTLPVAFATPPVIHLTLYQRIMGAILVPEQSEGQRLNNDQVVGYLALPIFPSVLEEDHLLQLEVPFGMPLNSAGTDAVKQHAEPHYYKQGLLTLEMQFLPSEQPNVVPSATSEIFELVIHRLRGHLQNGSHSVNSSSITRHVFIDLCVLTNQGSSAEELAVGSTSAILLSPSGMTEVSEVVDLSNPIVASTLANGSNNVLVGKIRDMSGNTYGRVHLPLRKDWKERLVNRNKQVWCHICVGNDRGDVTATKDALLMSLQARQWNKQAQQSNTSGRFYVGVCEAVLVSDFQTLSLLKLAKYGGANVQLTCASATTDGNDTCFRTKQSTNQSNSHHWKWENEWFDFTHADKSNTPQEVQLIFEIGAQSHPLRFSSKLDLSSTKDDSKLRRQNLWIPLSGNDTASDVDAHLHVVVIYIPTIVGSIIMDFEDDHTFSESQRMLHVESIFYTCVIRGTDSSRSVKSDVDLDGNLLSEKRNCRHLQVLLDTRLDSFSGIPEFCVQRMGITKTVGEVCLGVLTIDLLSISDLCCLTSNISSGRDRCRFSWCEFNDKNDKTKTTGVAKLRVGFKPVENLVVIPASMKLITREKCVEAAEVFTIWKKFFYLLDQNGNGYIDRKEFTNVFVNNLDGTWIEHLSQFLAIANSLHADMLESPDGRKLLALLFEDSQNQNSSSESKGTPTQQQVAELFSVMDTNRDNEVEWTEYLRFLQQKQKLLFLNIDGGNEEPVTDNPNVESPEVEHRKEIRRKNREDRPLVASDLKVQAIAKSNEEELLPETLREASNQIGLNKLEPSVPKRSSKTSAAEQKQLKLQYSNQEHSRLQQHISSLEKILAIERRRYAELVADRQALMRSYQQLHLKHQNELIQEQTKTKWMKQTIERQQQQLEKRETLRKSRNHASIVLQSTVRSRLEQKRYHGLKLQRTNAAVAIQCMVRRVTATRKLQVLQEADRRSAYLELLEAVLCIQSAWKRRSARRWYEREWQRQEKFLSELEATICIQAAWRGRHQRLRSIQSRDATPRFEDDTAVEALLYDIVAIVEAGGESPPRRYTDTAPLGRSEPCHYERLGSVSRMSSNGVYRTPSDPEACFQIKDSILNQDEVFQVLMDVIQAVTRGIEDDVPEIEVNSASDESVRNEKSCIRTDYMENNVPQDINRGANELKDVATSGNENDGGFPAHLTDRVNTVHAKHDSFHDGDLTTLNAMIEEIKDLVVLNIEALDTTSLESSPGEGHPSVHDMQQGLVNAIEAASHAEERSKSWQGPSGSDGDTALKREGPVALEIVSVVECNVDSDFTVSELSHVLNDDAGAREGEDRAVSQNSSEGNVDTEQNMLSRSNSETENNLNVPAVGQEPSGASIPDQNEVNDREKQLCRFDEDAEYFQGPNHLAGTVETDRTNVDDARGSENRDEVGVESQETTGSSKQDATSDTTTPSDLNENELTKPVLASDKETIAFDADALVGDFAMPIDSDSDESRHQNNNSDDEDGDGSSIDSTDLMMEADAMAIMESTEEGQASVVDRSTRPRKTERLNSMTLLADLDQLDAHSSFEHQSTSDTAREVDNNADEFRFLTDDSSSFRAVEMSVDATVRHVFGYDGSAGDSPPLQLADESTIVYVSGHALHFTSTTTQAQHFLLRPQPRKIVAFDFNWKTSTFAITAREPEATISLYSYPDKKPKAKLQQTNGGSDEIFEYSLIKFSRCGRRLLSIRPAPPDVNAIGGNKAIKAQDPLLCVWDVETQAPVPGCEHSSVRGPARFASFDPTNVDQFVVGGDNGLHVWKVYTGKTAASSLLRAEEVTLPAPSSAKEDFVGQPTNPADLVEWEEMRKQFCCHAWLPRSRFLVGNQAGDLLLVDTAEAKIQQYIRTAARPDRCPIVGLVVTAEAIVIAYSDGALAWLQLDNWELLNTGLLPGGLTGSNVTVMAPTPTYAKAYVGTRNGKIFEVRMSVMQDDDEDAENEDDDAGGRAASRSSSRGDESSLIVPCASFPTGPTCDSAVLTPFGGAFSSDALIATGGVNGCLALWNLRDCRPTAEVNLAVLFTQDPTSIGATGGSNSRPDTAGAAPNDLNTGATTIPPPVIITALAARPGDPIVLVGDHQGRLSSVCVAKVVGGGGKVEILPQHSVQLLSPDAPIDLLSIHPTQAVLMVSSTQSGVVFLLSMDHEKRFPVQAFFTLREPNERIVDIQWNATGNSASSSLTLTCFSSRGLFYSARYQAPPQEDISIGSSSGGRRDVSPRGALQIVPKVIAFGEAVLPMCARLRFLAGPSSSMMIATFPGRPELTLLKYRDVLHESMEEISILSKVLTKRAHARGVSAVAIFPRVLDGGVELLATGGMDGTVTLWTLATASAVNTRRQTKMPVEGESEAIEPGTASAPSNSSELDEMQATKKRTLVTHEGPVTTLRFVCTKGGGSEIDGPASIQLISTGVDGCVFLMDIRLSPELHGESIGLSGMQNADPTMNPLYVNVVSSAKYDDVFQPEREQERTPFLEARARAEAMAARDRFDRGKDGTRVKLRELEGRLKIMLAENERLPESEQLSREEFVLNVAWRDNLLSQHAARAQRVREGIARDLARMAIVRERMKREFWDVSEVPGLRLIALSPPIPANATNIPPGAPGGQQQPSQLQQSASTTSTSGQSAPHFVSNFPMRRQTPREQKLAKQIAMLRLVEYLHYQQEDREGYASDSRTRFQETVPSDLQWVLNAGSLHPKFQQGGPTTDAAASHEISEYAKMPSFHFVYHPVAVRTRKQALVQIHLLGSYARALQSAFNTEFQDLVRQKENTMEQIEAKNARIVEITTELNTSSSAGDLFRPKWAPEEKADYILKVSPEEMTQKPYETAERRKQREREAQEAAEREKARKKDDVGGRALMDMMDGTLEVKKDPLAAQELVKEAWMLTIPPEEMTAEEKKLVAQFEAAQAKFEEEREKYRKSLDLELRKTRGEVIDHCRIFDDKLRALRDRYMATRRTVLAQELHQLRLAEELMAREQLELESERLENEARTMQEKEARAQTESDRFAAQLEACREDLHRATEEDKLLEKTFVRELEKMVQSSSSAGGGTPTASTSQLESPEFIKQLVELYRKRKPDDLALVRDGASGHDSIKRTTSTGVTATRAKTTAKQRLLAESAGEGSSSRALLLKQASSKNNVVELETNLDPFQHLDNQHHEHSRRGSISAVGTGSQKFEVVPLDYVADRPEGVLVEDRIWRALNALRGKKILAEHAVREKAELLTLAKTVSDELRTKLSDLQRQRRKQQRDREALAERRTALMESAPLLVRIKQGQDETPVGGGGDDALLVARTSVEALNDVIQLHGKDQVGILGRIRDFRKSINVMEWEHALLELQARDMDERYTDIQLLRVTKDLQELFHTGDTSHKQKREAAMLEAKLAHLGRHHQATLLKLERTGSQLERQLRDRERENRNFQQQVAQLETQVQIREDILASRTSAAKRQQAAGGGGDRGDAARLKAIAVRRKLVDLAKAQTDEIEYLRLELDKMRRRTFPSFAQAHAREYHDVD
ncbi:unnamed protein product [Phytophthora lilii]|uniref:Cilia- and flagella-associated protein 43 n=1 Tax=Phytophthora lilii TaxID=2077276 RepID=A0A9W6TB21_9STRA|nr:unnamed protein product [Phytophthora lilii]